MAAVARAAATRHRRSMDEQRARASIDGYIAAWNETDAARRGTLLAAAVSDDIRFVTPGTVVIGRDALDARMDDFQRRRPGQRAVLASAVEILRTGAFRYVGAVEGPGVASPTDVLDVGECDEHGRIRLLLTFPGAAPAERP